MPETVRFLTPNDLHDIVRGMAVVATLYDKDPDIRFRLDKEVGEALGVWKDPVPPTQAGNECHFLFSPDGSAILGFDHQSPMSPHVTLAASGEFEAWPGVYAGMPEALRNRIDAAPFDDAFDPREVTFCLWTVGTGRDWQKGDIQYPPRDKGDPDGQAYVLGKLKGYYDDFSAAFEETYNWDLDPDAVADLLSGDRISLTCVRALKSDANPLEARRWLTEMGFVVEGAGGK